jgi:hypothetical protein
MSTKPEFLQSGETPRLIPVVADSGKEKRAVSILMATMIAVDEFRTAMLASIGVRAGARADLSGYTEVVFKGKDIGKDRPDGLLILNTGKSQWTALIEAKIGNSELESEQIAKYVGYAKDFGIDAVITLSNQFVALPDHHPIQLQKSIVRSVKLFHWSWMAVVTQATLVLSNDGFASPDQRYILSEALRYWCHDSAGISKFDRMNKEWRDVVDKVRNRSALNRSSPEIENTVASWHQEARDLCLLLSRRIERPVRLRLPRAHRNDPLLRLKEDCDELTKSQTLLCEFEIPGAAAPMTLCADLATRAIRCSMRLQAPADRKRSTARVNWLLRQLRRTNPEGMYVRGYRRGRAEETECPLSVLIEDPSALDSPNTDVEPAVFEVFLVVDVGGKFSGSKTFIDAVEDVVPRFYEEAGQYLREWVPPPPTISPQDPVQPTEKAEYNEGESARGAPSDLAPEQSVLLPSTTPGETFHRTEGNGDNESEKP